jgi:hypothetical protein
MYRFCIQFARIKRLLKKLEDQNSDYKEYLDYLTSFFIQAWALKEWIKNDDNIKIKGFDIEKECEKYPHLMLCADLANKSKHLILTKPRINADIVGFGVTIYVSTIGSSHRNRHPVKSKYKYIVKDKTESKYTAIDLAKKIVMDWQKIVDYLLNLLPKIKPS